MKITKFDKVTYDQFSKDYISIFNKEPNIDIYNNIKLPKRATKGSAGYDFMMPIDISLQSNSQIIIPTGIRCKIDDGYVLCVYPRSSLGFKYNMSLANTVGIIDSDYYNTPNQGHIMIKIVNNSKELLTIKTNDNFVQGIFLAYGITIDDDVSNQRVGGIGSTNQ